MAISVIHLFFFAYLAFIHLRLFHEIGQCLEVIIVLDLVPTHKVVQVVQ